MMRKEKYLVFATLVVTFFLLILGGVVHNTGSSLACPDWPLCYGQVFPEMKGGILIEHSHRLLASAVGLLTIFITVMAFRVKPIHRKFRNLSMMALVFVIVQGILGGLTVIYRLPPMISTLHLGLSMIYFCTLIAIYHEITKNSFSRASLGEAAFKQLKATWNPNLKIWVMWTLAVIYFQMVFGAFMRHTGYGFSCGLGMENIFICMDMTNWEKSWWPSFLGGKIHMIHRLFAYVVCAFVVITSIKVWKQYKSSLLPAMGLNWQGKVLSPIVLVLLQILLGMGIIGFNWNIVPTTAHLAIAAVLLGVVWKLFLDFKNVGEALR